MTVPRVGPSGKREDRSDNDRVKTLQNKIWAWAAQLTFIFYLF